MTHNTKETIVSKLARGQYVRINGVLHAVTGRRQAARTAALLAVGQAVPITQWTGTTWFNTGLVLYGSRAV